jgi:hypothetical protein
MGFPSCLENDLERAYDRLFMAGLVFPRSCAPVAAPEPIAVSPTMKVKPFDTAAHARHVQSLRDIHLLCLSELRPRHHAH